MKRIILFFAVCLGLSVSQTTFADDAETARVATKRTSNTTVAVNTNSALNRSYVSDTKRTETQSAKNTRTATKPVAQKVVNRTSTTPLNVKSRTSVTQPTKQTTQNVTKRISTTTRNTTASRVADTRKQITTPVKTTRSAISTVGKKKIGRAAELNATKIADIKSADYSKCKTVYYECMDEFCANKDTNLRRCACSTRIHEFDDIKKQLNDAEDKMLDFNQRLLIVGLDKEDAAAVNVATEGELAFQTTDKSESEKLLQKITKTLNSSGDSKLTNDLSSISLSLDMDSAWDNVDALSGIATTSKSGLALYNAAHPVCIEMAKEVCSDEELQIVQDGYKLNIQQDCNTVAKSYDTLYNNAMGKIHESGALLDMARLNIYQQRNSDDTLTCKKKILDQLSDASVCGENLHKCLDMTGKYIDPSNGKAFLSADLSELTTLLQEPTGDEKWSTITQNESFVNFLKSKKTFLEPAIAQCQDISDTIWKDFLDDALSQIKLAQNAKIEEVRQSCATLVAECKTNAMNDLSDFDARALSIFNVAADKTANEMCSNIQNSCIALTSTEWGSGMIGIATDITYDAIMDTCSQIGRDCIIEKCNGTSGNFALCKSMTSDNRMAILKRDICWDKVLNCVNGADNLDNMNPSYTSTSSYYALNSCSNEINNNACKIAKQIWGECDKATNEQDSQIIQSGSTSTLLSWFATNTGNTNCNAIISNTTNDCGDATDNTKIIDVILNSLTNYCSTGVKDMFSNCCVDGYVSDGICVKNNGENALFLSTSTCNSADNYYCPGYVASNPRKISVYCITQDTYIGLDGNGNYTCNGEWILVDQYGNYFDVSGQFVAPKMSYNKDCDCTASPISCTPCQYSYDNINWSFGSGCTDITDKVPTDNEFLIKY